MKKPVYEFRFRSSEDASRFLLSIDKEAGSSVRVQNPYIGKGVYKDTRTVLVTGTGSAVFDMVLKEKCIHKCEAFGGCIV